MKIIALTLTSHPEFVSIANTLSDSEEPQNCGPHPEGSGPKQRSKGGL